MGSRLPRANVPALAFKSFSELLKLTESVKLNGPDVHKVAPYVQLYFKAFFAGRFRFPCVQMSSGFLHQFFCCTFSPEIARSDPDPGMVLFVR